MSYALQYRRRDYGEDTSIFHELSAETIQAAVDEAVELLLDDMTEDADVFDFEEDIYRYRRVRIISYTIELNDLEKPGETPHDLLETGYEQRYRDSIRRQKEYEERRQRQHYETLKKRFEGE